MKAVLIGNYGVGNFGDEALREYFLRTFPAVEWTVVSARPGAGELYRLPIGIRSFFGMRWPKTIGVLRRSDAVVFGGGTLFTDIESIKACVLWGVHALAARLCGVPYHLAFQGIGPFHTRIGAWIARWVVRSASSVSVRDDSSYARIRSWRPDVVETFDPVFSLFVEHKKPRTTVGSCVLIPRHNSGERFDQVVDFHADDLKASPVVIATFQPDDAGEQAVIGRLRRRFPSVSVQHIHTVDDVMAVLADAKLCIAERFHGALAVIAAGVSLATVSQAEGDKISSVPRLFGRPEGWSTALERIAAGEEVLRQAMKR